MKAQENKDIVGLSGVMTSRAIIKSAQGMSDV